MSKILALLLALTFLLTACNNQPPQTSSSLPATEPPLNSSASSEPVPVKKYMGGILDDFQAIHARNSFYNKNYDNVDTTITPEKAVLRLLRDAMPWEMTEPQDFTPLYSLDCNADYFEDSVMLHIGQGDGATFLRLDRVRYDTEYFRLPEEILPQIDELMAPYKQATPILSNEPPLSLLYTMVELLAERAGMLRDYRNTAQLHYFGDISGCPTFYVRNNVWNADAPRKVYPIPSDNFSDYPFLQEEGCGFLLIKDNTLYTLSEAKAAGFPYDFQKLYEIQWMDRWDKMDTPDERRVRMILETAVNLGVLNWDGKKPVVAGEPYAMRSFPFEQEVRPYTSAELEIMYKNPNSSETVIPLSVMEDFLTALFGENHIANKGENSEYQEEAGGYVAYGTSFFEYTLPYFLNWQETADSLTVDCVLAYISHLKHDSIDSINLPDENGWLNTTPVDLPITKSANPSLPEIVAIQDQFTQFRATFVRGESGQYHMTSILPTTSPKQK